MDLDVGAPFRKISDIEKCVKLLIKDKKLDCVTTGYESERNPYFNMVQMKKNGFGKLVCNTSELIFARQRAPKVLSLSPVCFAIRCSSIFKYANWSESNFKVHEISRESSIDIDTDFDFKIAKLLWNNLKKKLIDFIFWCILRQVSSHLQQHHRILDLFFFSFINLINSQILFSNKFICELLSLKKIFFSFSKIIFFKINIISKFISYYLKISE